jgi:L-threonylcarbamoyladenylate synthase
VSGNAAGREPFDRQAVDAAVRALRQGQAVVLPTDTVYGVAVLLSTPGATQLLSMLKDRSVEQALAVLIASLEQAKSLTEPPSPIAQRLMAAFWPGPVTLVLRRRRELRSLELGGDGSTIGLRWPRHALVCELASRLGPLVTTSANRHGQATPVTASEAAEALAGPVAAVIAGGVLAGLASTVIDCAADVPRVLREGTVTRAQISSALEADS